VTNRNFVWILTTVFFLMGIALGGYDLSGSTGTENLTAANPIVQSLETDTGSALANAMAPQAPATESGTEIAFYTTQSPTKTELKGLMPFNAQSSPSTYVFYKGSYLGLNGFTSQSPSTSPSLWIERSVSWSWYATMPLGAYARELLYVPVPSPITLYEVYPSGFVMKYNLGFVQPGYYYIWYYADTPGRHLDVFSVTSGYSNMVVIDVYSIPQPRPVPPKPVPPTPKQQCEKNPLCNWMNGQCLCTGLLPENPEKLKCEQKSYCSWVNGQCLCTMPNPDDQERISCEQNPDCDWVNGQCLCRGLRPEDPEKVKCEQNPDCNWVNGRCLCTGLNPPAPEPQPEPTPMPGPVPNPNPEPDNDAGGDNSGGLLGSSVGAA
jgi:hypothetical protein